MICQSEYTDLLLQGIDNCECIFYIGYFRSDRIDYVYMNASVAALTGIEASRFISGEFSWLDCVVDFDRKMVQSAIDHCRAEGERFQIDYRVVGADGKDRYVSDSAGPVHGEDGTIVGYSGIVTDVSVQKRVQNELERTQLLQSLGKLIAGIAHEINSPVQFVGDNLQFLADSFDSLEALLKGLAKLAELAEQENCKIAAQVAEIVDQVQKVDIEFLTDEVPRSINESIEGVQRVSKLVSAMRDFSHIDERRKAPADVNKAIESSLMLLRNELKYIAEVDLSLDPELPMVYCSIDEINQVLLNLLINAGHSISDMRDNHAEYKGFIKVATERIDDHILIRVADNGCGIPEDVQGKIFQQFFTTKTENPDRKGTGQGLSMTRKIVVDHHHGSIDFESEVGVGTTFMITLPIEQKTKRS